MLNAVCLLEFKYHTWDSNEYCEGQDFSQGLYEYMLKSYDVIIPELKCGVAADEYSQWVYSAQTPPSLNEEEGLVSQVFELTLEAWATNEITE